MRSLSILLIVVVAFAFNSCNKKTEDPTPATVCRLVKQTISNLTSGLHCCSTYTLVYDNRVLILTLDSATQTSESYEYDEQGRLTKVSSSNILALTYDGDDLVMQEWLSLSNQPLGLREVYEYSNHRVVKAELYTQDTTGNYIGQNYRTFEYSDDTYNVSKLSWTRANESSPYYIEEYTYGQQHAWGSALPEAIKKWYRVQNVAMGNNLQTITIATPGTSGNVIVTYECVFDENGLPLSEIQKSGDQIQLQVKNTYSCQ